MRISRLYQPAPLIPGDAINLTVEAAHYLRQVLRLDVGAELRLFNGDGGEYAAAIIALNKQHVTVQIGEYFALDKESSLKIHLGQAISRGEKMDWVIQKAVELGVAAITPLFTARCGVKLAAERGQKRLQHWQSVAISACEQCGRNTVPLIHEPRLLADWLKPLAAQPNHPLLVLHPTAAQTLSAIFPASVRPDAPPAITLLIGPEGGLSEEEITAARQQGFTALSLGPRILRTETAALAALAALQCWLGDMK
jgi:16S rRNA (uracil1498-N3)-methyltransferase